MTATLTSLPAALASTGRSPQRKIRKTKFGEKATFDNRLCSQTGNGIIAMAAGEFMKEMR